MLSSIEPSKGCFCIKCFLLTENLANQGASALDYVNNMEKSEEVKEEDSYCFYCEQRGNMTQAEVLFEGQPCCLNCRSRKKTKYNAGVPVDKIQDYLSSNNNEEFQIQVLGTTNFEPMTEELMDVREKRGEILKKSKTPDKIIDRFDKRKHGRKINTFTGEDFVKLSSIEKSPIVKRNKKEYTWTPKAETSSRSSQQFDKPIHPDFNVLESKLTTPPANPLKLTHKTSNSSVSKAGSRDSDTFMETPSLNNSITLGEKRIGNNKGFSRVLSSLFGKNPSTPKIDPNQSGSYPLIPEDDRLLDLLEDLWKKGIEGSLVEKEVLFKSRKHNLSGDNFHKRCDKKSGGLVTFVVMHTGFIFGAYHFFPLDKSKEKTMDPTLRIFTIHGTKVHFYFAEKHCLQYYRQGVSFGDPANLRIDFDVIDKSYCSFEFSIKMPTGINTKFKFGPTTVWSNLIRDIFVVNLK